MALRGRRRRRRPVAFFELFRQTFATAMQAPMLRGIFGMIRRVSGDSAATLIRNAPRLYGHVTRDVGELAARIESPGDAALDLQGWPSQAFAFEVWLSGTQACILGALQAVGVDARVDVELRDEPRGFATYRARW